MDGSSKSTIAKYLKNILKKIIDDVDVDWGEAKETVQEKQKRQGKRMLQITWQGLFNSTQSVISNCIRKNLKMTMLIVGCFIGIESKKIVV